MISHNSNDLQWPISYEVDSANSFAEEWLE